MLQRSTAAKKAITVNMGIARLFEVWQFSYGYPSNSQLPVIRDACKKRFQNK
jgi:hypothetical protein